MSRPTPEDLDRMRMSLRPIQGPKCGTCGRAVGLVQINGHSFSVEPGALVIEGGTILLSLHLCTKTEPQPTPQGPKKRPGARR